MLQYMLHSKRLYLAVRRSLRLRLRMSAASVTAQVQSLEQARKNALSVMVKDRLYLLSSHYLAWSETFRHVLTVRAAGRLLKRSVLIAVEQAILQIVRKLLYLSLPELITDRAYVYVKRVSLA